MLFASRLIVPFSQQMVSVSAAGVLMVAAVAAGQLHVPDQYGTIQEAVNAAEDGDTILVGPGEYTGSVNLLGKSLTLLATHGPEKTILDGEDQNISVLVIVGDPNEDPPQVVIEGFTITRGRGTLIDDLRRGGGLRAHHAEITVTNCVFIENHNANRGAGMYVEGSTVEVIGCRFENNRLIAGGHGGGMYALASEVEVLNSAFLENRANRGAGIAAVNSTGIIHHCDFLENITTGGSSFSGGGIYSSSSIFDIANCEFRGNGGGSGAGMHIESGSHHTITNCHFEDNVTSGQGGAMAINSSSPTIQNCQFINNRIVNTSPFAWTTGGAIMNANGSPIIINCHFDGNDARGGGAAMSDSGGANMNILHCTFVNNTAYGGGAVWGRINLHHCTFQNNHASVAGGAAVLYGQNLTVDDCTFHANSADDEGGAIYAHSVPSLWITNSTFSHNHAISGGGVFTTLGTTIVLDSSFTDHAARTGAAMFVDEDQGGRVELQNVLFCRMQETAIHGPWMDFGGVNFCPKVIIHVPAQYSTIQQAIFAAQVGTEILVAPGVYNEAIDLLGKAITVRGSAGPDETVINATGIPASVVTCANGEPPGTRISGFTITGGTGSQQLFPNRHGGGFAFYEGAAPTIEHCIITGNQVAVGQGGALAAWNSRPMIQNCQISGNTNTSGSTVYSGNGWLDIADTVIDGSSLDGLPQTALVAHGSSLTLQRSEVTNNPGNGIVGHLSDVLIADSVFENNQRTAVRLISCQSQIHDTSFIGNTNPSPITSSSGGALHISGGTASVNDCLFQNNFSAGYGGAVGLSQTTSMPSFIGCRFIGNRANNRGGAIWMNITARFNQSEFRDNIAENDGGAIFAASGATARLWMSMFCNNAPNHLAGAWLDLGGNEFLEDCPVLGDLNGDGVVDVSDLLLLFSAWGPCPTRGTPVPPCPADLNGDGAVDVSDLLILLANWG